MTRMRTREDEHHPACQCQQTDLCVPVSDVSTLIEKCGGVCEESQDCLFGQVSMKSPRE